MKKIKLAERLTKVKTAKWSMREFAALVTAVQRLTGWSDCEIMKRFLDNDAKRNLENLETSPPPCVAGFAEQGRKPRIGAMKLC